MQNDEEIWGALADLFFLDTEPSDSDFEGVARLLKNHSWDSKKTEDLLVKHIAPLAGANLGYLIWPVIGEWSGFDRADLAAKIRRSIEQRKSKADWRFFFVDWWSRKMLRELGAQKLYDLLAI